MIVKKQIDLKHHAEIEIDWTESLGIEHSGIRLIKTTNGQAIPDHEPVILFRGRDRLAAPMLRYYRNLCVIDGCNDFQLGQVDELIKKFEAFAVDHAETMKQPGITRGL